MIRGSRYSRGCEQGYYVGVILPVHYAPLSSVPDCFLTPRLIALAGIWHSLSQEAVGLETNLMGKLLDGEGSREQCLQFCLQPVGDGSAGQIGVGTSGPRCVLILQTAHGQHGEALAF